MPGGAIDGRENARGQGDRVFLGRVWLCGRAPAADRARPGLARRVVPFPHRALIHGTLILGMEMVGTISVLVQ